MYVLTPIPAKVTPCALEPTFPVPAKVQFVLPAVAVSPVAVPASYAPA